MYLHHLTDARQAATVLSKLLQRANARKGRRRLKAI